MTWPAWTEVLKERFLADEASVFLVVGDIHAARWSVEGEDLDAANVLVRMLARSRPVVGVLRNGTGGGLRFPTYADEVKFDQLVEAAILMSRTQAVLSARDPHQALGRVWQALNTIGVDQAYMVVDIEALLHRKKRVEPIPAAPPLLEWPDHPTIRQSNNLVIFMTAKLDEVHPQLAQVASVIRLDGEPVLDAATQTALEHTTEDVLPPATTMDRPSETPAGTERIAQAPAAGPADYTVIQPILETAITEALLRHPETMRDAKVPIMDAVASVMRAGGASWGELTFDLDEEGGVVVGGDGGADFLAMWRGDIALDAASGMLLKSLKGGFSAAKPPELDEVAMRALSKRVAKKLQ